MLKVNFLQLESMRSHSLRDIVFVFQGGGKFERGK